MEAFTHNQISQLKKSDLEGKNPIDLFALWLEMAEKSELNDPSAMTIATVDEDGMPNIRPVLMRRYDDRGFCFFTNFNSQKGQELLAHPKAALMFHWKSLRKGVRIRGEVEPVRPEEADDYFNSRHRESRIASIASQQSEELDSRETLIAEVDRLREVFGDGEVPRPDNWSGFRIMPLSIEFWADGEFRMHDRFRFDREKLDQDWEIVRLYP